MSEKSEAKMQAIAEAECKQLAAATNAALKDVERAHRELAQEAGKLLGEMLMRITGLEERVAALEPKPQGELQ